MGEPEAAAVTLSVELRHSFPAFSADIAFTAPTPGVVALFGPSGCGKSTVLAAIAGLLRADHARVALDGVVLSDLPVEQRRIGQVFQEGRLFPHMNVAANLRYGLRRAAPGAIRFDDVVEMLGIGHLLARRPRALSGGERQRVAIGRAVLAQPLLLLMDEPLAALDAARKEEILPFLARLRDELRIPIVYISHALEEVGALADTVVLLDSGRVVAAGALGEIAARADLPLAARDDAGAVLDARVAGHEAVRDLTRLTVGASEILVPTLTRPAGAAVRLRIPAREIILATEAPRGVSLHNILPGTVRGIASDPARRSALVEVGIGDAALLAQVTPDAVARLGLTVGRDVLALFKSVGVQIL